MDDNNRNLIQFPTERVKRKGTGTGKTDFKSLTQDPRKAGAAVSILSVMLLAFYMNPTWRAQTVSDSRMPASYGDLRTPEYEKQLEQEFLNNGTRYPASMGREPSMEDRLRVGDLHGRYRLLYRDEHVFEIALIVGDDFSYEPIVLSDRKEFLERYRNTIYPTFDSVEPALSETGDLRDEQYVLKKDGQVVGLAKIKLDKFGRFYSMKVE